MIYFKFIKNYQPDNELKFTLPLELENLLQMRIVEQQFQIVLDETQVTESKAGEYSIDLRLGSKGFIVESKYTFQITLSLIE